MPARAAPIAKPVRARSTDRTRTRRPSVRPDDADGARSENLNLSELTSRVGFMLRMVQIRVFQKYYDSSIGHDVALGALSALIAIRDNPGIRHGALADILLVRRPNMTKLVGSLAQAGLISRRSSSRDGRGVALFITAKGGRMLERAIPPSRAEDEAATGGLTDAERSELLRLLGKMAASLIDDPAWSRKA